jgi:hypothetical protein
MPLLDHADDGRAATVAGAGDGDIHPEAPGTASVSDGGDAPMPDDNADAGVERLVRRKTGFFETLIAELGKLAGLPTGQRNRLAAAGEEQLYAEQRALKSRAEQAEAARTDLETSITAHQGEAFALRAAVARAEGVAAAAESRSAEADERRGQDTYIPVPQSSALLCMICILFLLHPVQSSSGSPPPTMFPSYTTTSTIQAFPPPSPLGLNTLIPKL